MIKQQVLELSFQCTPDVFDFVKSLSLKLVFFRHSERVSISKAHAKVRYLLVFAQLNIQSTGRRNELKVLSET